MAAVTNNAKVFEEELNSSSTMFVKKAAREATKVNKGVPLIDDEKLIKQVCFFIL